MQRLHVLALVLFGAVLGYVAAGVRFTAPAQAANRVADFDEAIRAQGIPIFGVSGSGPTCRIDFKPEATAGQRTTANNARATFDWTDAAGDTAALARQADIDNDRRLKALATALVTEINKTNVSPKLTAAGVKAAFDSAMKAP